MGRTETSYMEPRNYIPLENADQEEPPHDGAAISNDTSLMITPVSDRCPALDGLRGIAALLVVLVHHMDLARIEASPYAIDGIWWQMIRNGWMGVDLFFVLSGYLITGILADHASSPRRYRAFYGRRVLRIFPLVYAYLTLTHFVLPHVGLDVVGAWKSSLPYHLLFGSNFLIVQHGFPPITGGISHFWSLAVEEQFYLLWPLVIWSVGNRRGLKLCWALLGATILMRGALGAWGLQRDTIYVLLPTRLDGLALGGAAALAARVGPTWMRRRLFWAGVSTVGAAVLALMFASSAKADVREFPENVLGFAGIAAMFAGVVALAPGSIWATRLFARRWLVGVGQVSFALYIFHLPIARLFGDMFQFWAPPPAGSGPHGYAIKWVLGFTASCSFSLLLARASWRWYEEPILRLRRYVRY